MKNRKGIKKIIFNVVLAITAAICGSMKAYASSQFSVSPMYQFITLTPGEQYVGNFQVVNPAESQSDFYYKLRVEPFSAADETNDISLTASNGDYNRIVDWISLQETEGVVPPNSSKEVRFTIDVPENSPGWAIRHDRYFFWRK